MALSEWEGVEENPRQILCIHESGCEELAVLDNPYRGKFAPMCFLHSFLEALDEDTEAQEIATEWVTARLATDRG